MGQLITALGFCVLLHATLAVSKCGWLTLEACCAAPPQTHVQLAPMPWGSCPEHGKRAAVLTQPLHRLFLCSDRDVLKFTQQEYSGLPQNLQLEVLLGTVLCLIGGCSGLHADSNYTKKCVHEVLYGTESMDSTLLCIQVMLIHLVNRQQTCCLLHVTGGFAIAGKLKPIVLSRGAP